MFRARLRGRLRTLRPRTTRPHRTSLILEIQQAHITEEAAAVRVKQALGRMGHLDMPIDIRGGVSMANLDPWASRAQDEMLSFV